MDNPMPKELHKIRGGHQVAIDRTADINNHVNKAVYCLTNALNEEEGSHIRGGNLRQGYDYLETIIRFAKHAQHELRNAYVPPEAESPP